MPKANDPIGKHIFTAIILLLIVLISVQVGIAKGRQMQVDDFNRQMEELREKR